MNNAQLEIVDCFCLWSDILGFGKAFYDSNWQLTDEVSVKNLMRIKYLEQSVLRVSSPRIEKMLALNDGFIHNVDYRNIKPSNLIYWLMFSLEDFLYANISDVQRGFYGLRGVLTCGQRAVYTENGITLGDMVLTSPERKVEYDKINIVYSPREFQMNTAFSKAYIIENAGSAEGISGHNLYIDELFINKIIEIVHNSSEMLPGINLVEYPSETDMTVNRTEGRTTFSANFDNEHCKLMIQAQRDGTLFNFLTIWFCENPVIYDDEKHNIHTKLWVPLKMITCREPECTHDFQNFSDS